jgi:tetratricopeptide (TPR) repeat protein
VRAVAAGFAVVAAVSYALPALAAREIERAARRWDRDPAEALTMLDRARHLNPLTDRADLVAGALALRSGDRAVARRAFQRAAARDGANWYPRAALGVLDLDAGRRAEALVHLRAARRRDPREALIAAALAAAEHGAQSPVDTTERLLLATLPGPLGRKSISCRPVLGLAATCARRFG